MNYYEGQYCVFFWLVNDSVLDAEYLFSYLKNVVFAFNQIKKAVTWKTSERNEEQFALF